MPLLDVDGRLLGAVLPGHEEDDTLTGQVLLENLACKATAALALRHLLARPGASPPRTSATSSSCGEEAVGDRYQRGGGNLAKAVAEWAGCARARRAATSRRSAAGRCTRSMLAGALVRSGLARRRGRAGGRLARQARDEVPGPREARRCRSWRTCWPASPPTSRATTASSPVLRLDAIGRHEVGLGLGAPGGGEGALQRAARPRRADAARRRPLLAGAAQPRGDGAGGQRQRPAQQLPARSPAWPSSRS